MTSNNTPTNDYTQDQLVELEQEEDDQSLVDWLRHLGYDDWEITNLGDLDSGDYYV